MVKVERLVAADSYFDYVKSEKLLEEIVLEIISVIKQAPRQYPMPNIRSKTFTQRYNCYDLMYVVANEGFTEMVVFAWVFHYRQSFIATREYIEELQAVSR